MRSIRIQLKSDLCAGNGESVGYGIDSNICMDAYGFPYIPAKRILGCLRDSMNKLGEYGLKEATPENINAIFGDPNGTEGLLRLENAMIPGIESMHSYIHSLKNEKHKRDYLIQESTKEKVIQAYSYVRGQTKIGEDGKAEDGSLRFIRVLNQYDPVTGDPIEFLATMDVSELNEQQKDLLKKACVTLHHIGMNRNRGLGNVSITIDLETNQSKKQQILVNQTTEASDQVLIRYQVAFDSPITVQEYLENGSQIKARTMIGIFSKLYLNKNKEVDDIFQELFLTGAVKWSALTPVINGHDSVPTPAMIMKLKNGGGKLINSFACTDNEWKKMKPKSLDGSYISKGKDTFYISQPEIETVYHNRLNEVDTGSHGKKAGLYMQESLKQGMLYSGYVILPKDLLETVKDLLNVNQIRLGRSKKVQYGNASIRKIIVSDYNPPIVDADEGEPIFAILKSDLILQENAMLRVDHPYVRRIIAEQVGLENHIPEGFRDICRYHVLTGYQTMWHMQKPKIQAIMGGSVYCFTGNKKEYPSQIVIGEYQQEGMGIIELIPMRKMKEMQNILYGNISMKAEEKNDEVQKNLEDVLLFKAAIHQLEEKAFLFRSKTKLKLNEISVGRFRVMLTEAESLDDLRKKVDSMKTSDVSSESEGRKKALTELLKEIYGNGPISVDKLISNQELKNELSNNPKVKEKVMECWKEPLFTLIHMIHYQKSRG